MKRTSGNPTLDERFLVFQGPLCHYRCCRNLRAAVEAGLPVSDLRGVFEQAIRSPYASKFTPSAVTLALFAHKFQTALPPPAIQQEFYPPAIARQLASDLRSLGEPADAWADGFKRGAEWLFCKESDLCEEQLPDEIGEFADEARGIVGRTEQGRSAYLTLSGWKTGLGTVSMGGVEFRSFGPMAYPLGQIDRYGLALRGAHGATCSVNKTICLQGWTRALHDKGVWLHVDAECSERVRLCIRARTDEPFVFAFFVKADRCELADGTQIAAKSLQKFRRQTQTILFNKTVSLSSTEPLTMNVIPLAGEGCFWNTTFLVAFEMNATLNGTTYFIQFQ